MKHCEPFDHTADVGLQARADELGELFEALAEGLADYICPRAQVQPAETRRIKADSDGLEDLAVEFLWKVMDLIQADHFAVAAVRVTQIGPTALTAEITGERLDLARHDIHTEVKAVTYHMLKVAREGGQWTGRVILDL